MKTLEEKENQRIYSLATENGTLPPIRYILTANERMSDDLDDLLLERRIFVLDAWREQSAGNKLISNIEDTFQSISGAYDKIEDVIIYSAYPGNGTRIKSGPIPMELTKSSPEQVVAFLLGNILSYYGYV
ncbi:hypothetical protein [Rhizobium leguminosarum]|uniref:hypothetical protein n=1 Tax=Rhizobium leguminosarum TaxID=384 RepID=UPI0013DA7B00|nr:hypothetical protein [Rhizobium leguminosarum]NEK33004.1 hypothetical protein [Rhizobium leguminosarum]